MKNVKLLLIVVLGLLLANRTIAQHNAGYKGKVLMIASNKAISGQTGWPIGVWWSELSHPYWTFTEAGYAVDIASPEGGELYFDQYSDPEDQSKYSAFDIISLGFKKDPAKLELTKKTLRLQDVNPNNYKAIFVCGGQGPMYTFVNNESLQKFFVDFYQTGKPTAAICHGTSLLLKAKLPNGKFLVDGKRWTGFSSSEEQYVDNYLGLQLQPFRIEDEAKKMANSRFEVGSPFYSFAVRDGNLITGQQQNSGTEAAQLVIKAIEEDKDRYPTYVLVHGAWADESAFGFIRSLLAVHANVVVVNLPAHGIDLTPKNAVKLSDYANALVAEISKQNKKVILVGHSMAGMVISLVAEMIPDKIDKMVYVSAYLPKNGQCVFDLAGQDTETKLSEIGKYNSVKGEERLKYQREVVVPALCEDCPDFMKEIIVKYYSEEPMGPLAEKVSLTDARFGSVPKYYIHTTKDFSTGYKLQQKMVKENGNVVKTFTMNTSHLPFVVQPQEFVNILESLK